MIIRNKILFYLLSFTWGLPMTLIGCLAAVVLLATRHKPQKWGYCYQFEFGRSWGGVNLGPIIITDQNPTKHTKNHEAGHSQQNCIFGPFMIVISLMSFCRYWYRELKYYKKGLVPPTAYDDVWYEGQASTVGTKFIDWYNNNTK